MVRDNYLCAADLVSCHTESCRAAMATEIHISMVYGYESMNLIEILFLRCLEVDGSRGHSSTYIYSSIVGMPEHTLQNKELKVQYPLQYISYLTMP